MHLHCSPSAAPHDGASCYWFRLGFFVPRWGGRCGDDGIHSEKQDMLRICVSRHRYSAHSGASGAKKTSRSVLHALLFVCAILNQ